MLSTFINHKYNRSKWNLLDCLSTVKNLSPVLDCNIYYKCQWAALLPHCILNNIVS